MDIIMQLSKWKDKMITWTKQALIIFLCLRMVGHHLIPTKHKMVKRKLIWEQQGIVIKEYKISLFQVIWRTGLKVLIFLKVWKRNNNLHFKLKIIKFGNMRKVYKATMIFFKQLQLQSKQFIQEVLYFQDNKIKFNNKEL